LETRACAALAWIPTNLIGFPALKIPTSRLGIAAV